MRKRSKLFLLLTFLVGLCSCSSDDSNLVPGVTLELAKERKETISELNYKLHINIPAERSSAITGEITVDFEFRNNARPVVLDFNVDQAMVSDLIVNGAQATFELTNEKIVIPNEYFIAGANTVFLKFEAGETSLNRNDDYLYTLFVPDRASTAFPCFDQPNLKASYELALTIPETWKAMANGAALNEEVASGRKTIYFAVR